MKTFAAFIIILGFIGGLIGNYFMSRERDNMESTLRWELLETDIEGDWSYWRDNSNPELCFAENTTVSFWPSVGIGGVTYVPCDKILTNTNL